LPKTNSRHAHLATLHRHQLLADAAALLAPRNGLRAVAALACCVHAAKVQLAGICLVFAQHLLQQTAAAAAAIRLCWPAGSKQLPNLHKVIEDSLE
jgi:hypothetical protein